MSALEKMRKFVAGLEDTSERPHHGDVMFYVGKKPFASCGGKSGIVVGLEPDHAATLISQDDRFSFYSRAQNAVQFDPAKVPKKEWEALVRESYAIVSKAPAKKKTKSAKK